ncbi:HRDC domain-containing protein [bacterium]|nr:HRDC domain-containing protein [bacterium]
MQCRVFTIPFSIDKQCFDDAELTNFLSDKELIELREHIVLQNGVSYLVLIICYKIKGSPSNSKVDYKDVLSADDYIVYNLLREWRNEEAKKMDVAPYMLFSNKQLALIAEIRPQNRKDLLEIPGINESKMEQFGIPVISIVLKHHSNLDKNSHQNQSTYNE